MSQRHYSPDQLSTLQRNQSPENRKRLREGGSTNKLLSSLHRFNDNQITIGDYSYRLADQIGAGYSSRVYKCAGKDKLPYAIKVIQMKKFSASGLEMLENEIQILKSLNHPNVIKLYYAHRTQSHTYIVTQLCKQGDLLEYLSKKGRLAEELASSIMSDVIQGVKYLMKMGIVHRDLKPANILRSDKTWKIADFGFSIYSRQQVRTRQNVGTPLYMPIESLLKNIYSPQSDIFAIGVIYYELLLGMTPWQCRSEKELIKKLTTIPFSVPQKYKLSVHIKFLLNKMCAVDNNIRMQKQQFFQLNLKNFVSLNYFNDPLTSSKRLDQASKKTNNHSSVNKIKRSKTKNKIFSKEKEPKAKIQYKLGRRKKSTEKDIKRKSVEKEREVVTVKIYALKEDSSNLVSLVAQESGADRFDVINEKVLLSQLEFCRFIYYLIHNSSYMPLPEQSLNKIIAVLFKHLVKLIKQLSDTRFNHFRLPHWDGFKQSSKAKNLFNTCHDYCQKYQKEYLKHLKQANMNIIKEINQKFSELGSSSPLSLSFYRKMQTFISFVLKQCLTSSLVDGERISGSSAGYWQGISSLLQYYRWIELNAKYFQNYALQKNRSVQILKNYKNSELSWSEFSKISEQIRALS